MEPLSLIFSAIVAGAAAAVKPTAEKAVKDAYAGLKALIKNKWGRVEVESLERDPTDETRQELVKKDLQKADGLADEQVLERAKAVLAAVKEHDPDAAEEAGITLEDLEAGANINLQDLVAEGSIVVRRVKAKKDFVLRGARAGKRPKR